MRRKIVAVVALGVATACAGSAAAQDQAGPVPDTHQESDTHKHAGYLLPAALVAAGVAALAGLAGKHGGAGDSSTGGSAPGTSSGSSPASARTLLYTGAADFQTPEYQAQQGLGAVNAASMYYNGAYRWFTGAAADAAAGTGRGIRIAVADTGISAREATSGSSIAIDAAASYDYVNNRSGSSADDSGHGTHVAGIIAAPKNDSGMHGLAYNATLVNFKVGDSSGAVNLTDAQFADMLSRAAKAGAMIVNNSWALAGSSIVASATQDILSSSPRMVDASRAYVAAGGVVVFAAGNDAGANPALQPGLPYRISGLQPGWLAVVAIDGTGRIAGYSNRCGVAAAWCLAAPGGSAANGIYSMSNSGGYASMYGTSMAAPHAAAAIAALKSMFVNLSTLQIRDRLLYTANRSGSYADTSTYGQGVMDLGAASSPVGGVSVPTGASANGATAPVAASAVVFQKGAVQALRLQARVLVVDNYQRAPFWVPAATFFHEATPRLLDRQWASLAAGPIVRRIGNRDAGLRLSYAPGLNAAMSIGPGAYRLGFSQGAGGETALGAQLDLASLPRLAAPGTDSVALGYSAAAGIARFGLVGTFPTSTSTQARVLDSSSLGSRRSLGAVAQRNDGPATYGWTFAVADRFERPIGIATSGAFAVGDAGAISTGAFVQHAAGANARLEASYEIAHHRPQASLALDAPAFDVRSASFGAHTAFGARTTVSASLKREWTSSAAAQLRLPLTIAETGDIGQVSYALAYDDLVGRTALVLRVDHELTRQVAVRASFTQERYGFGVTVSGVAAILQITQ